MNKKGLFNFIFGFIGLFIFVLIMVTLLAANETNDLPEVMNILETKQQNFSNRFSIYTDSPIQNVVYSFINFVVYSSFEVAKLAVEWGYENPQISPLIILWIILISLLAPIAYYLFLGFIVIFLLIREWYLIKKERKQRYERQSRK